MHRLRLALIGAFGVLIVVSCLGTASLGTSHEPGLDQPVSAKSVPTLRARVARSGPIHTEHVFLRRLAAGYTSQITESEALELAFQQLGPSATPTSAQAFLGTDPETGNAIWVVTYQGVCGEPNVGPPGNTVPSCLDDTASIALDATTGDFIVAW